MVLVFTNSLMSNTMESVAGMFDLLLFRNQPTTHWLLVHKDTAKILKFKFFLKCQTYDLIFWYQRIHYILHRLAKGVNRNKARGGGKSWTVISKHFLDTLNVINYTVQLPYIGLLYPANKTSRKKQQINVFNTLHSSVSDLKSVIALSSRGGLPPPSLQV